MSGSRYPRGRDSYPRERSGYPRERSGYPRERSSYPRERSSYPRERSSYPRERSSYPRNIRRDFRERGRYAAQPRRVPSRSPQSFRPLPRANGISALLLPLAVVLVTVGLIFLIPHLSGRNRAAEAPASFSPAAVVSDASAVSSADPAIVEPAPAPAPEVYVPQCISCGDATVFLGSPRTLSCDGAVEWSGFDPAIVRVDGGVVEALAVGDTLLTATTDRADTYTWELHARKTAYLTFDDFPNENTRKILDTLDEKGVKATFFLCKLPKDSEFYPLYKEIADRGHLLGNHTTTHHDVLFDSSDNLLHAFDRMEEYLGEMGYETKFIRLPYGSADPFALGVRKTTCRKLRKKGYTIVDWSSLTNDSYYMSYVDQNHSLARTLGEDAEIILMHHKKSTANNLAQHIEFIRSKGYEFDTIDHAPMLYSQLYKWEENANRSGDPYSD